MRYTKIHTQIWNDEKFTRLTPSQQRLFLYILTSPHSNIVGFYVLKSTYIQGDLEVLPKDLAKDLAKLCHEGLISYDENLQVVLIHNWLKHNPITNPNQRLAAKKILGELPKTELFKEFKVLCEVLNEVLLEAIPKSLPKPCHPEEEEEEETGLLPEGLREALPPASKNGNIPYADIQAAYNEILTDLPTFRDITDKRRKAIKARWHTDERSATIDWWRDEFFPLIAESDFLNGRTGKKWCCNIDWILKPEYFQKIREGAYNNRV